MDPWIERQIARGHDASRAYLHIGKTGGTSFLEQAWQLAKSEPARVPVILPHEWTIPRIRQELPQARISFVIRDPLERIISGFMSRERAGRPTYDSPWTSDEAISFLFFPDVRDYMGAILSGSHRDAAAADFASKAIAHIRRGYRYHIPSLTELETWAGSIGRIEDIQSFAWLMLGPEITVKHMHANPVAARTVLADFKPEEIVRLRHHFAAEYTVFDALTARSSGCNSKPGQTCDVG